MEKVSPVYDGIGELDMMKFGLCSLEPHDVSDAIDFAKTHYTFDILVNIVYLKNRMNMGEICNVVRFYRGIEGVTATATLGVRNQRIMRDVSFLQRSLILISICLVSISICPQATPPPPPPPPPPSEPTHNYNLRSSKRSRTRL